MNSFMLRLVSYREVSVVGGAYPTWSPGLQSNVFEDALWSADLTEAPNRDGSMAMFVDLQLKIDRKHKRFHSNNIKPPRLWSRRYECEQPRRRRRGPVANIDKDIRADRSGSTRVAGLIPDRDAGKQTPSCSAVEDGGGKQVQENWQPVELAPRPLQSAAENRSRKTGSQRN